MAGELARDIAGLGFLVAIVAVAQVCGFAFG